MPPFLIRPLTGMNRITFFGGLKLRLDKDMAADCEQLLDLIRRFRLKVGSRLTGVLVRDSLTAPQYNTLVALKQAGEITMGTLAKRLQVTMAAATNLVDRLVRAELVERRHSESDRRVVNVKLTAQGEKRVAQSTESFVKHVAGILRHVSPEERKTFLSTYAKIVEIAETVENPPEAGSEDG